MPTPLEKCENQLLASKYRAEKIKEKFNTYYTLKPGLQLDNEGNPKLKEGYSFGPLYGTDVKDKKVIIKNETLKSSSKKRKTTKKRKRTSKKRKRIKNTKKTKKTKKTKTTKTTKTTKKTKRIKRKSSNKKKFR